MRLRLVCSATMPSTPKLVALLELLLALCPIHVAQSPSRTAQQVPPFATSGQAASTALRSFCILCDNAQTRIIVAVCIGLRLQQAARSSSTQHSQRSKNHGTGELVATATAAKLGGGHLDVSARAWS